MSKDPSKEIAIKLVYYLVVAKSSGWDYKHFKLKLVISIIFYTREIAPLWIAYGEVKVLKKVKIQKKIVRKEERSPVRGYELGKPSSPPLKKEDKGMYEGVYNISPGTKSNPSLRHDDLVK